MVAHNILLSVKQKNALDTGIEVTQGDFGQLVFRIRVIDDNGYLTNVTRATLIFTLSDGTIVDGPAVVNASVGEYTYTFQGNELQSPGKVSAVITLEFGNGRISSCGFMFNVRYNPLYDRRIPAGIYITALERIIQEAEGQIDYLNNLIRILQGDVGSTVLTKNNLIGNFLTTTYGLGALDAAAGKVLHEIASGADTKATEVKNLATQLNSDMNASVHGYITTGGDINTILDGIYLYNGWANIVGDKPFVNAYGIWIKRTPLNSIDSTARVDCVINATSGIVYVRTGGSEGSWKSK